MNGRKENSLVVEKTDDWISRSYLVSPWINAADKETTAQCGHDEGRGLPAVLLRTVSNRKGDESTDKSVIFVFLDIAFLSILFNIILF